MRESLNQKAALSCTKYYWVPKGFKPCLNASNPILLAKHWAYVHVKFLTYFTRATNTWTLFSYQLPNGLIFNAYSSLMQRTCLLWCGSKNRMQKLRELLNNCQLPLFLCKLYEEAVSAKHFYTRGPLLCLSYGACNFSFGSLTSFLWRVFDVTEMFKRRSSTRISGNNICAI